VVRRHEVLRTSFAVIEGQPVQVIAEPQPLALPIIDLTELAEAGRGAEVRRLANKESNRPFNLLKGPMLRTTVLKLSQQEHVVLITKHHIASDGWSIGVLVREVAALYEAYAKGETSPLVDLPVQYADYAAWQRNWLQGEMLEKELEFWKRQLSGIPALLELPTDKPRLAVQN